VESSVSCVCGFEQLLFFEADGDLLLQELFTTSVGIRAGLILIRWRMHETKVKSSAAVNVRIIWLHEQNSGISSMKHNKHYERSRQLLLG
jgi:hypothetical protein